MFGLFSSNTHAGSGNSQSAGTNPTDNFRHLESRARDLLNSPNVSPDNKTALQNALGNSRPPQNR